MASLGKRKFRIRAQLTVIEKNHIWTDNEFLRRLHRQLSMELGDIFARDEVNWIQRSTRDWSMADDQNTKFYHNFVKARKKKKFLNLGG